MTLRQRYDNVSAFGTAASPTNPITLSTGVTTTATWSSAPGFPTIAAPNYAVIIAEPDTANEETMYLTAFTSGATTGTVTRAQEGRAGIAHSAKYWVHGPTAVDFPIGPDVDSSNIVHAAVGAFDLGAR